MLKVRRILRALHQADQSQIKAGDHWWAVYETDTVPLPESRTYFLRVERSKTQTPDLVQDRGLLVP